MGAQKLEVVRQKNAGHGPAILNGYRLSVERRRPHGSFRSIPDGHAIPSISPGLWDVLQVTMILSTGYRTQRDDGFSRLVISQVLRLVVFCLSGVSSRRRQSVPVLPDG